MKPPFTDKFLWMVYNFFEQTGDVLHILRIEWPSMRRLMPMTRDFWRDLEKKKNRKQFSQFINYLKRSGYIQIANLKEKKGIVLTQKGRQKALKAIFRFNSSLGLKKRRDGKLLMLTFDIPEKKRQLRDGFRGFLYSLGFKQLQKSVWVSPYDIRKQLEEIITAYGLEKFIRIFLIEETETEQQTQ